MVINTMVKDMKMRLHKKQGKIKAPNIPGLKSYETFPLQSIKLAKGKVKIQFYKLKLKDVRFDLSQLPTVKMNVRFKKAMPAFLVEGRVDGKYIDRVIPDINWSNPGLEITARLRNRRAELRLTDWKAKIKGRLYLRVPCPVGTRKYCDPVTRNQKRIEREVSAALNEYLGAGSGFGRMLTKTVSNHYKNFCRGSTPHAKRIGIFSDGLRIYCEG